MRLKNVLQNARVEDSVMEDGSNITYQNEGLRKATHLFALVIPIGYSLTNKTASLVVLGIFLLMFLVFDSARLFKWKLWDIVEPIWGRMIRPQESNKLTGASYIMLAAVLTIAFFPKPVAVCALSFIIIGDTAGALIGRRWGKHRYRNKSYEGSLAFFAFSLIPAALVPDIAFHIGAIGAAVAAFTEAVSGQLDDNLSVPLVSGLVMHILIKIL